MPVRCDIYPDGGMVDALVLGTSDFGRVGSSPTWGTLKIIFDKLKIFTIFDIIIEIMRTTIKHMVFSHQQKSICWYERMLSCSSDVILR